MAKPFALAELSARLRALLRRGAPRESVLRVADLEMDTVRRMVRRAGTPIDLKPKEYALLEFLMRNSDRPLTKSLIIEHVWDIHFDSISNVVEVHINSLRNKIDRGFDRAAHPHRPRRRLHADRHAAVMTLTLRARLAVISTIVFGAAARRAERGVLPGARPAARRRRRPQRLSRADRRPARLPALRWRRPVGRLRRQRQRSGGVRPRGDALLPGLRRGHRAAAGRSRTASRRWVCTLTPGEVQAFRATTRSRSTSRHRLRPPAHLQQRRYRRPAGGRICCRSACRWRPMDAALSRYRDLLLWRVPAALLVAGARRVVAVRVRAARRSRAWRRGARDIDVQHARAAAADSRRRRRAGRRGDAFNETLRRLEHAVGEMRQFSAALAHELRTPLAALRGEIELALRTSGIDDARSETAFASQIEEIDRLTRLIDQILTLARAESGQIRLTFAPVDLGELAASLVEQLEPVAQRAKRSSCAASAMQAVVVDGDAGWLQRLLLNLLDNAMKFTSEGGHVVVRVAHEDGARAHRGRRTPGSACRRTMPQQAFERFFRADPARSSGHGGRRARPQPGEVDRRSPPRHDRGGQPTRRRLHLQRHASGWQRLTTHSPGHHEPPDVCSRVAAIHSAR